MCKRVVQTVAHLTKEKYVCSETKTFTVDILFRADGNLSIDYLNKDENN